MSERARHGMPVDRSPETPAPTIDDRPLLEWIPAVFPGTASPFHLEPLPSLLDDAIALKGIRALVSCPIRHWKSATVKASVAKGLRKNPALNFVIITNDHKFAEAYGRDLRDNYCRPIGVRIARGSDTIVDFRTEDGGGCYIMSNRQGALGRPVDVLIFDDPFADFEDADNLVVRDTVDSTISLYTSRLNRGGSVVGVMSRMHIDDPIGRRLTRKVVPWTYVCQSAIRLNDDGEEVALAPHIMSLEELRIKRAEAAEQDPSERYWFSQFQNDPRAGARGVFKGAMYVDDVPTGCRTAIGVDAAYSEGRSSDYFAAVVMHETPSGIVIVGEVARHQRGIAAVCDSLDELAGRYPSAQFFSYVGGNERAVYRELAKPRVDEHEGSVRTRPGRIVNTMTAKFSKEYRARGAATAWEGGMVKVLRDRPWSGVFVRELNAFTGAEGGVDDQVDAFVSGFDGLAKSRPYGGSFSTGRRVM